jgi:hypothetical protein
MKGKSTRIGAYKCYQCRKPFTVKVGTVFESSHIALHIWLQAMFLLSSGKKGISSNQLHRTLGITLKSAWFLSHRIREAMKDVGLEPIGGRGKTVEADETYFGDKEKITKRTIRGKAAHSSKRSVVALVERGGPVRTFHLDHATKANVQEIIRNNVERGTTLHTDESKLPRRAQEPSHGVPFDCEARERRVRPGRRSHQHRRGRVLGIQARHEGHLSARR